MASTFVWSGKTRQGQVQKGELVAKTREEVIAQLRKQNILVTSVQEKAASRKFPGFGGGVGSRDIVIFTRQFSTMIDAGLPLVQCLEILANQTENKTLAKTIGLVRADVESGSTYADALRKFPKVFDDLYVNMVAPGVIIGVAVIVISVLMVWVIPIFASMFTDFGGVLPLPTRIVVGASDFMKHNILLIIGAVIALAYGLKWYYGTTGGRRTIDRFALKVPVVGDLIRKAAVAKFTRTLGTLIASGVPILEGLSIVAKTSGNKTVEDALISARQSISEGKTVSEPLGQSKVFPPMVIQMIAVGETTGALDAMLSKIADFYDDEVESAVAALTSLLEPMLMVFLGTVIGFIVIAMYLPIF